jgi:hypothetical protein
MRSTAARQDERKSPRGRVSHELSVPRFFQPDDVTCGPTCLKKVYDYFGLRLEVDELLGELDRNEDGGTLGVYLAISALRRGFRARVYAYDLRIFDPSWFELSMDELARKIRARTPHLPTAKALRTAQAYLRHLELGGEIEFDELTPKLIKSILDRDRPVLAGLSATYLYRMIRERHVEETDELEYDDVRGAAIGHFVVIHGYDRFGRRFYLRDPSAHVPAPEAGLQIVDAQRLTNAILLGDLTYDAILLEIWPGDEEAA